ncbi:hypothetical protein AN687_26885 [Klebsiella variicola]|nr:hypothetical protein AN687_26885 [Klebsiella variicola]
MRSAIVCCEGYGFFAVSHQLAVKFRRTFKATESIPSVFWSISNDDGIAVQPMTSASSPHFSFSDDGFIDIPSKKCFFFQKKLVHTTQRCFPVAVYLKIDGDWEAPLSGMHQFFLKKKAFFRGYIDETIVAE